MRGLKILLYIFAFHKDIMIFSYIIIYEALHAKDDMLIYDIIIIFRAATRHCHAFYAMLVLFL